MKSGLVVVAVLLAGPTDTCGSKGDAAQDAAATVSAPSASVAAAAPSGAVATPPSPPAHAGGGASPPAHGPCVELAQKCTKCPPGTAVQTACTGAVTAGRLDPSACTNALNDKDIKALCGGGAGPSPPSPTPTTPTPPAPAAACTELAQKCKKCPAGATQTACNFAVSAGALDPRACANALADKDISSQCK